MVSIRKACVGLVLPLFLSTGTACFITNAAGTQPGRSYAGHDLRLLAARALALGWTLGSEQYIDSKKNLVPTGSRLSKLIEYRDYPTWFNTAFLIGYSGVTLHDHRFYREKTADDCLLYIQVSAGLITRLYLDNVQTGRTVSTSTGNASVDLTFVDEADFQKAILLAQPALGLCDFAETGKLVESKDYSF